MLLGAGVTRSARPAISMKDRPPLDKDFFDIALRVKPKIGKRVLDCLESLVGEYSNTLRQSLETATTYLYIKAIDSSSGSRYHEGFLDLMLLLGAVLAETTNPIKTGPASLIYRFLLGELGIVGSSDDLSIITFNYDLLFERVLEEISDHGGRDDVFVFPGCYRLNGITKITGIKKSQKFLTEDYGHNGVAVFKLHGSLNWQSTHTSPKPTPRALFSTKRELHVIDTTMISAALSWKRGLRRVYMKPVIVPPISGKRGMMHSEILSLWEKAGKALASADRVVIAGYSCPPLDLEARILLSENLRSNFAKKVYVIDPNPGAVSSFVDLCAVDHTTLYTSIKDWIRDFPP